MEVNLEMQKHIKLLEFIAVACQKANALLPSSLYLYIFFHLHPPWFIVLI